MSFDCNLPCYVYLIEFIIFKRNKMHQLFTLASVKRAVCLMRIDRNRLRPIPLPINHTLGAFPSPAVPQRKLIVRMEMQEAMNKHSPFTRLGATIACRNRYRIETDENTKENEQFSKMRAHVNQVQRLRCAFCCVLLNESWQRVQFARVNVVSSN